MNETNRTSVYIPFNGFLLLGFLCLLWGGNMIAIKVSNQGVPPIMAATIRSFVGSLLLWIYATALQERVFLQRDFVKHGIVLGLMFGTQFICLFWGLKLTNASRAVIFFYTQPLWTVLLAHLFLHDERLSPSKGIGAIGAMAGLCLVFGSRAPELGPIHWVGDLMVTFAGLLWAATTVYVKRFIWNTPITMYQILFAQLFYSIPVLVLGVVVFEWGLPISFTEPVIASLFYQTVIVAFASYLAWFWLIYRYQAVRISVFTFLTPIFGVILSRLFLQEQLTAALGVGLVMVASGIYLVNRAPK